MLSASSSTPSHTLSQPKQCEKDSVRARKENIISVLISICLSPNVVFFHEKVPRFFFAMLARWFRILFWGGDVSQNVICHHFNNPTRQFISIIEAFLSIWLPTTDRQGVWGWAWTNSSRLTVDSRGIQRAQRLIRCPPRRFVSWCFIDVFRDLFSSTNFFYRRHHLNGS